MKNRTPVPRDQRPPLPDFAPVPRKCARHDGWTPARQKAFIEALADTGSVSRAAAMVNMSPEGAYFLRRQPGADEFRRAWEAALDCGVARMKDIAFERAITGYLVPMFVGGRLIGWRRKHNDRLLMFCLRHYGEDESGKRTTINYFSTRATAGPAGGMTGAALSSAGANPPLPQAGEGRGEGLSSATAEASTTTVRTVITGGAAGNAAAPDLGEVAALLDGFAGVELDERARAELHAVLRGCAERRRLVEGTADDEQEPFIAAEQPLRPTKVYHHGYAHPDIELRRPNAAYEVAVSPEDMVEHAPALRLTSDEQYRSSDAEFDWQMLDQEEEMAAVEEAVASVKRAKANPPLSRAGEGQGEGLPPDAKANPPLPRAGEGRSQGKPAKHSTAKKTRAPKDED